MIRCLVGFLALAFVATAQTVDIAEPYRVAIAHYQQGDLDAAVAELEALVARHDRDAVATIGPAFGNVWYYLGLCRMEQGDLVEAALAFRHCHTKYANPADGTGENTFQTAAVIKRGEIEQSRGQFGAAAKLYAAALKEIPSGPAREPVLLRLAICLHEAGDSDRPARICRALIEGDATRPELKRLAVLQSCRIAVEQNDLSTARALLRRHSELMTAPILERAAWTRVLLHIGRRCTLLDEPVLALQVYELAASGATAAAAEARQSALAATGYVPGPATNADDELDAELLLSRADAWFHVEAWRLARAGYAQAAPELAAQRRAQALHAASVCSAMLDEPDRAESFAQRLIEITPDYPMLPEVIAAWIESLLRADRLREARDVAWTERDRWDAGNFQREPLDFLAASAGFQLKQYGSAEAEFEAYLAQYPAATRRTEAAYSRAVCLLHQRRWRDAKGAFDELLADDTAREWTDGSLYYRALCLTMLEEVEAAEADSKMLLVAYPTSPHRGDAWNLLGDLRFREKAWDAAEELYTHADEAGDPEAAAYSAYQRIRIALAKSDHALALMRYQAFREQHDGSRELPQAVAVAASVYEAEGQVEAALELLTREILDRADRGRDAGLETLMNAHNALYKRAHGYQALVERLRAFPGAEPTPPTLAAWLALSEIEALESVGGEADRARIQDRYRFLAVNYELDELEGIFILKLARWLEQTGDTASAISYYTVLTTLRDEPTFLQQARIERSRLLRRQPSHQAQALEDLQRVLDAAVSPDLREAASVEIARHWFQAQEWERARTEWEEVLADPNWQMARGEATYGLAFCLDQLGMREAARRHYVNTYIQYEGQIDWSAAAFLRTALMAKEEGQLDQAAQILDDMMSRMGHLDHPVVNRARTLHRQWQEGRVHASN